jgi:hypothetical protein
MFSSDLGARQVSAWQTILFFVTTEQRAARIEMLHGWIMHDMKQDIHTITTNVLKWVLSSTLEQKVTIIFPDLHVMFRRDKLDVNLVTICST